MKIAGVATEKGTTPMPQYNSMLYETNEENVFNKYPDGFEQADYSENYYSWYEKNSSTTTYSKGAYKYSVDFYNADNEYITSYYSDVDDLYDAIEEIMVVIRVERGMRWWTWCEVVDTHTGNRMARCAMYHNPSYWDIFWVNPDYDYWFTDDGIVGKRHTI